MNRELINKLMFLPKEFYLKHQGCLIGQSEDGYYYTIEENCGEGTPKPFNVHDLIMESFDWERFESVDVGDNATGDIGYTVGEDYEGCQLEFYIGLGGFQWDCEDLEIFIPQASLGGDLEESLNFFNLDEGDAAILFETEGCPTEEHYGLIKKHHNTIRQALANKDQCIKDLRDTLEITVIAEMLDLINNGKPIPPTRKELQSTIDEIKEVLVKYEFDDSDFKDCIEELINR